MSLPSSKKLTYISIFSGIEAASVAWEPLGFKPVAFAEVDPFPSAVLKKHYPHVPNLGDITTVNWSDYHGKVDIVVGGSPCQSFSIAGKREGLAGASGLMFEYIRAVREIMPRYFVWENVPGALSSEKGEAFRQLLSEMDGLGYGLAWRILDAQFFGVAQRRRRVFLVGSFGDNRASEVLFEPDCLHWDHPPSREKREELARAAENRARASYTMLVRCGKEGGGKGALVQNDVSATLSCANAQALFQPASGCTAIACDSDIVVRAFSFDSLSSNSMKSGNPHSGCREVDLAKTLDTTNPCPSKNQGGIAVLQPVSQCMASGQASSEIETDTASAQTARQHEDPQIVCMSDDNAKASVDFDLCGSLKVGGSAPIATDSYVVRRLTPRECERLQGFPDDWTKIAYRGKTADDCPDAPRYKALGNSMAVPVMRWIGERLLRIMEAPSENQEEGSCHD